MTDEDLRIEACAIRSWPATVTDESGGWLLRATPEVGRKRSNSAVPPLHRAIDGVPSVEDFYTSRDADVLVQVAPAHRHGALDEQLAARGYELTAPTLVMRAEPAARDNSDSEIVLGSRDQQWMAAQETVEGSVDAAGTLVMDRIPGRTTFARAIRGDDVAGIGAAVVDDQRLGIFGMATVEQCRRSGVASAVLAALFRWGREQGAVNAWLQVEESNIAAQRLYESHGFTVSHRYHYRRRRMTP